MSKNTGGPAFPSGAYNADGLMLNEAQFPGMTLRDYFIAHAPSEPQPWFSPVLPKKEVPLPIFVQMFPDYTEAEFTAIQHFNSDCMRVDDVREERVRNYLFQREEQHKRDMEYAAMAERERYIQWPAAWADAMLKARAE